MNRDIPTERATPTQSRTSASSSRMNLLAENFVPGKNDVICGRGKKCYNHIGNERFRRRVISMLDDYSKAKSKLDKSSVLNDVVEQVRLASPDGGFVKQDAQGRWYEVGDFLAREKTSQAFRDALHEHYKSSNVAKKKKRQEEQAKATDKMQKIARSEFEIASRMKQLSSTDFGKTTMDLKSQDFLNQTNFAILDRLNRLSDMRHERSSNFGSRSSSSNFRLSSQNTPVSMFPDTMFRPIEEDVEAPYQPLVHTLSDPMHLSQSEILSRSRFSERENRYRPRQRSYSLPSSPQNLPTYEEEFDEEELHHSLPNMKFSHSVQDPIDEMESLHQSLPNLQFSASNMDSLHQSMPNIHYSEDIISPDATGSSDFDPIPLDMEVFNSKPAAKPVPPSGGLMRRPQPPVAAPPSNDGISRDLIACLEKLTESSITDDNPFEPIPLTPEQRRANLANLKAQFRGLEDVRPPSFEEG